jgi:hypothetical protein
VKLKRHDGRIRRCKMLLRKRNNVLCVCNWIGVWLGTKEWENIYRMNKSRKMKRGTSSKLNILSMRQSDS